MHVELEVPDGQAEKQQRVARRARQISVQIPVLPWTSCVSS